MTLSVRQRLRAVVWEMTGGMCEWPGCASPATELAHITPRGMGHTGYRDRLGNVMAACPEHARITDDMAHACWRDLVPFADDAGARRFTLAEMVTRARRGAGFDVAAMQTEIDTDDG